MMKNFIIKTAEKAGKYLLKNFKKDNFIQNWRGYGKAITTKYDLEADKIIRNEILKNFPNHSIMSEESDRITNKSEWLWIVDPLDGTSNYASGNPFFSVCIALMNEKTGELLYGVVYAPALNEMYFAEKGKGAWLNNKRIQVSKTKKVKDSYVLVCGGGGGKNYEKTGKISAELFDKVKDLRKLGSAGIETAWVASGRTDSFVVTQTRPWDVASGALILLEAGGKITDFEGKPWRTKTGDYIFSNGKIHKELLTEVKKIVKIL
jgi:myo-inositol-1(or 4)-monophosphatase